jgi:hypothetical protein
MGLLSMASLQSDYRRLQYTLYAVLQILSDTNSL